MRSTICAEVSNSGVSGLFMTSTISSGNEPAGLLRSFALVGPLKVDCGGCDMLPLLVEGSSWEAFEFAVPLDAIHSAIRCPLLSEGNAVFTACGVNVCGGVAVRVEG